MADAQAPPPTPSDASAPGTGAVMDGQGAPRGVREGQGKGRRVRVRACRFFGTAAGCREGTSCPFLHDETHIPSHTKPSTPRPADDATPSSSTPRIPPLTTSRAQAVTKPVPASRVVPKPVPQAQAQDPREFQLGQVRRRYKPRERQAENGAAVLDFDFKPSDPDFPFEMDALRCSLVVPEEYPEAGPSLRIRNSDIPRGFSVNVERGFDGLVEERKERTTLLALMGALDKNLEAFLSEKKAETVTLVKNADMRHLQNLPVRSLHVDAGPAAKIEKAIEQTKPKPISKPAPVYYSKQEKEEAKARRDAETRQLEARLGRLPLYKKSGDGIAYTLPVEPRRRSELPVALQAVKTVVLFVPLLYPLQNCRVVLEGVKPEDARTTEAAFEERTKKEKQVNLMGHVNYLAQNMHVLAKTLLKEEKKEESVVPEPEPVEAAEMVKAPVVPGVVDEERGHIVYIPRPPEWTTGGETDSEDFDDSEYSYDSEDSDGRVSVDGQEAEGAPPAPLDTAERGTALSFPFLELYGIELLEVTVLNLTVKCERCKDTMDITGLRNGIKKTESCKKCATPLSVTLRRDFIHANAVRAGFLDLEGCTPVDLLPSTFLPTCATCSEPHPSPGIVAHPPSTTTLNCRHCHASMTLTLPAPKFLRITSAAVPASGPRRKREDLRLHQGERLPLNGSCVHYSKSFRWFRFSCCNKVYPCDRCHDEKEQHPNERAERMVCGWCSREQVYRKEDCGFCGRGVIRKRGGGFWEGGKGTRDKIAMSRKDPRKYKRRGANVPGGKKKE